MLSAASTFFPTTMKSTEPRDMTWNEIRESLSGTRERVWDWLLARGPATTSDIAEGLKMNLLTVRPRVSELVQLGFAECVGRSGHEGIYQVVSVAEAQARHAEQTRESQLPLKLQ